VTVEPRHIVCALGTWSSLDDVARIVARIGGHGFDVDEEYSLLEPDQRMARAFEATRDRVAPSWTDEDDAAVARHTSVAYIRSPHISAASALDTSARMLAVAAALLDDGGALAIKGESSGIAHGAARWRELASRAASAELLERASALHAAWVRRPIADDDGTLYSCGMHLLGEPDAEVHPSDDVEQDIAWLDLVAIYLLAEKPASGVHDGEGFRMTEDGERRILHSRPCTRYPDDDFFHNPYGYWRLELPA
jgi:hypothetical protein